MESLYCGYENVVAADAAAAAVAANATAIAAAAALAVVKSCLAIL